MILHVTKYEHIHHQTQFMPYKESGRRKVIWFHTQNLVICALTSLTYDIMSSWYHRWQVYDIMDDFIAEQKLFDLLGAHLRPSRCAPPTPLPYLNSNLHNPTRPPPPPTPPVICNCHYPFSNGRFVPWPFSFPQWQFYTMAILLSAMGVMYHGHFPFCNGRDHGHFPFCNGSDVPWPFSFLQWA